jgi:hypothetical protein
MCRHSNTARSLIADHRTQFPWSLDLTDDVILVGDESQSRSYGQLSLEKTQQNNTF